MDKPISVKKLLRSSKTPAERVLQHGQYLHRIENLLGSILDNEFRLQCRVGNVRDGVLIIYCSTTAWATRLRYQAARILDTLKQHSGVEGIKKIEVRILPVEDKTPSCQRTVLSNEAAQCIMACADSISDSKLSEALHRLAKRQNKKV